MDKAFSTCGHCGCDLFESQPYWCLSLARETCEGSTIDVMAAYQVLQWCEDCHVHYQSAQLSFGFKRYVVDEDNMPILRPLDTDEVTF